MRVFRVSMPMGLILWLLCQTASASIADIHYRTNILDYRTYCSIIDDNSPPFFIEFNYREWFDEEASDVIVYVAGLQSHSQWFNDTGDYFADIDYNVYAWDRRGSGLSSGRRGHIHTAFQWISDLDKMINVARAENPGKPLHLMANSFGVRIAMSYAAAFPHKVDSLILMAPGTHMQVSLPPEQVIESLFRYRKYYPTPLRDELFTDDPEKLAFMAQDELGLREVTANVFKMGEVLNTGNLLIQNMRRITLPVLVLLSNEDKIIDPPAVISGLYDRLETHKKLITYDNVEHFLLFEDSRQQVLDDITEWIDSTSLEAHPSQDPEGTGSRKTVGD